MILLDFFSLLILLTLCCFVPGFVILKRLRWSHQEKLCGSIAMSMVIIYLAATAVYWLGIDWTWCWIFTGLWIGLAARNRRDLWGFFSHQCVRDSCRAFGMLLGGGLLLQMLARHYSGGGWATDWLEHYQRSLFFLLHLPFDSQFIGLYLLPARPPMSHLIAAYFLRQSGSEFDRFQIIFLFLNAVVFFPCILIAGCWVRFAARRIQLIAIFLVTCPMVLQNMTYTWNKQASAFFVLCSIAFYLRGWKCCDSGRLIFAAICMGAAILTHYSAGPYAVFLGAHYLLAAPKRKSQWLYGGAAGIALLATWFAWSIAIYGVTGTFMSNTTAAETGKQSAGQNVLTAIDNIYCTLIPHPLRMSSGEFGVMLDQPNRFGYVRDYFFNMYQPNLLVSLGIGGWLAVVYLLWIKLHRVEKSDRRFWIGLIFTITILGTAVIGAFDPFGDAHICLQPLTLLGRILLAVGFMSLGLRMRLMLVISMIADVTLGIILQCRMQMQIIHDFQIGQMKIVPYSRGLLSFQAVVNSTARFSNSLVYLADYFKSAANGLLITVIAFFALILWRLANAARSDVAEPQKKGGIAAVVLCVYLIAAGFCISDRWFGFSILSDSVAALPSADVQERIAAASRQVRSEPESSQAMESLGEVYYGFGQLGPAKEALENALLLKPDDARVRYILGLLQMLNRIERPPQDPIFPVLVGTYRQDAKSYVNYGITLYSRGFKHKSLDVLADAVRRFPAEALAHEALGMVLFDSGEHAQGMAELAAALRLAPDSVQIADQMRTMQRIQGESPESDQQKHTAATERADH